MSTVVRTIDISTAPVEVWAVLSDFGAISGWAPNVDHSCLMSDRTDGIGTVRRIQTGRTTVVERVLAWDPPATLSYELEGLPPIVESATNTWHVYGMDEGTRVSLVSRIDAGAHPPQRLAAKVVATMMAKASDQMLAGLKARLS